MKTAKQFTVVFIVFFLLLSTQIFSQDDEVRKSLHANVSQTIGVETEITIDYSRPGVKGREIWGELIPYGLFPGNKYSGEKPFPWRVGANENTTIEITNDVLVVGQKLPAGKYSIHAIPSEGDWIIIFNTVNDAWGSYQYNEENDALRVTVTPVEAPHQEWLMFGFEDLAGTSATCYMHWEKLKVPIKIEVAGS